MPHDIAKKIDNYSVCRGLVNKASLNIMHWSNMTTIPANKCIWQNQKKLKAKTQFVAAGVNVGHLWKILFLLFTACFLYIYFFLWLEGVYYHFVSFLTFSHQDIFIV